MSNKLKCSVSMERSQNARGEAGYLVDVRVWVTGGEQKRQRLFCRGSRADATVFGNEMQNQLSEALLGASAPRIPTYGVPPSAIGAPPLVPPRPQPPRVRDFVPVFLRDYMRANKRAESTVDSYEYRLRLYVVPALGNLRLNELGRPALTKLKASLSTLSAGSVNDVLAVLSKMLDFAVGQELLPAMPYRLKDVKLQETVGTPDFYDFEEFERLVKAAYNLGPVEYATVLLGGEAGLRRGEIAALQWPQVDLKSGRLTVSWSLYKKTLGPPKGRRSRTLQMTDRLRGALTALLFHPALPPRLRPALVPGS